MTSPWDWCRCGHLMLLHDVDDMDGSNPTCCVDGCDQNGCGEADLAPIQPGAGGTVREGR